MGRPFNGVRFLLIDLASEMRLKERLPREGRNDDGYDSTDAHISAMAGFRKPISTRRTVLKRKSAFACYESSSVSLSLVHRVSRASSNTPTCFHVPGSLRKLTS